MSHRSVVASMHDPESCQMCLGGAPEPTMTAAEVLAHLSDWDYTLRNLREASR